MKDLTIIIPFLNEGKEPEKTIESIYKTTSCKDHEKFNIIAIDDAPLPLFGSDLSKYQHITFIKNKKRIGVDGCRQLGTELAKTQNIFILDGHMRFNNDDWFNKILDCVSREKHTLWCSTCSVLGYGNMEISRSIHKYYGASLAFINREVLDGRPATQILEPKWIDKKQDGEYEIPCILGANYFFNKEWYDYLHGLRGLKMWGTSEPFLSLKSWLSGGKCKISTNFEIGHKFRNNAPYSTNIWCMIYNKLYLCKTILNKDLEERLIDLFPKDGNFQKAMIEIDKQRESIFSERQYYDNAFRLTINEFCNRFNITI